MSLHGDVVAMPNPTIIPAANHSSPPVDNPYSAPTIPGTPGARGIHPGAIVTIILTLLIFFGAIVCVFRTSHSLGKLLRRHRGHPEESEGRKGGARKLRKMLVIGLLISDCIIALSSFWPAVAAVAYKRTKGEKCVLPGFLLASALWWQYGFSLTIAVTTYVALRHPLSVAKDFAERGSTPILATIIVVGAVQAIVWKALHGFHSWRDTCYYAPPSSLAAELIQFLPRLITSVIITAIYVPLIHFLRRPDMTSLYLSPRASAPTGQPIPDNPDVDCHSSSSATVTGPETPPWEKLNFPTFHLEEHRDSSAILGAGLGFASAFLPSKSSSRPSTPGAAKGGLGKKSTLGSSALGPPRSPRSRPQTAPTAVIQDQALDAALETSLSVGSPALRPPTPLEVTRIPAIKTEIPRDASSHSPRRSKDNHSSHHNHREPAEPSARLSPPRTFITPSSASQGSSATLTHEISPAHNRILRVPKEGKTPRALSNYHFGWQRDSSIDPPAPSGDHLQVTLVRPVLSRGSAASRESASFRGMLELAALTGSEHGAAGPGGAVSGAAGGSGAKSMASVMNRSASSFLLWFPLTHLVISALTITRYASYAATRVDGPALEAMTTLVVLGQSAADVIIFGFIERRTRHRYRHEVDKCKHGPEGASRPSHA